MLARKLGIALDDVVGTTSTNSALLAPTTSAKPQPGFNFSANVPQPLSPEDPMSAYTMNVVPVDPYGVVPPFVFGRNNPLTTPVTQTGLVSLSVSLFGAIPTYDAPTPDSGSPIVQHDYEVDEDPGAPSLAGWTMHIDDADGHRVSGQRHARRRLAQGGPRVRGDGHACADERDAVHRSAARSRSPSLQIAGRRCRRSSGRSRTPRCRRP